MSALSIQVPFPVFQDRDGQPLDNGYIWIGQPNLNPQTNPVVAYYDDALTIVATQPLRTINGYVSRAGTPAQVYVDAVNFSILVQDSKGSMVYNFPEGTGISPNAAGVVYDPAGASAVATTVQAKLRETVSVKDFGAVGDGVADDTAAIQSAINQANLSGYDVLFDTNRTYITGTLTPKSNVKLNLQGSTLKLKAATNWLLIDGTATSGSNFSILNGTLDPNKSQNNGNVNQAGGGIWLVGWNQVLLQNVSINNAFRSSIVLNGCSDVTLDTIEQNNCGQTNAFGFFGYGLEAYNGTSRLVIRNFYVNSMYGFGIHFFGCTDFCADNLKFNNLTYGGAAIAITWTQAQRGRVGNVLCQSVDGDTLEVNASIDQVIENVSIVSAGDIPLLFGDNGTGVFNERVTVRNFKSTSTGGAFSARINYVKRCSFQNLDFDKSIDTFASGAPATGDRNNSITDSIIAANISTPVNYYNKFHLLRVAFSNFYVNSFDGVNASFSNPQSSGSFNLSVANSGVTYVDFVAWDNLGFQGFKAGKLKVLAWLNNSQGTYHEVPFYVTNTGSAANLGTLTTVSGSFARDMTIAADAVNKRISITNSTGNTCFVQWSVDLTGAMSF